MKPPSATTTLAILLLVLIALLLVVVAAGPARCYGQCQHGDKECQRVCNEREWCPEEGK